MPIKQGNPRRRRAPVNPTSPGPLAMPHERDETPEDRASARPQPAVAQAARDLEDGLVDTDNYTRTRDIAKPVLAPRRRKV